VEQLKIENSRKWRLQERDDWKALVDSVQKDRDRLHDECIRLETSLNQAHSYIQQQENLLAKASSQLESTNVVGLGSDSTIVNETSVLAQESLLTSNNNASPELCNGHNENSPNRSMSLSVSPAKMEVEENVTIGDLRRESREEGPTPKKINLNNVEIISLKREVEKLTSQVQSPSLLFPL